MAYGIVNPYIFLPKRFGGSALASFQSRTHLFVSRGDSLELCVFLFWFHFHLPLSPSSVGFVRTPFRYQPNANPNYEWPMRFSRRNECRAIYMRDFLSLQLLRSLFRFNSIIRQRKKAAMGVRACVRAPVNVNILYPG